MQNQNKPIQAHTQILNERITRYSSDTLTNEELLHKLTGIPIVEIRKAINTFGLVEIIKYKDSIKTTPQKQKKLEFLFEFCKRLAIAPYKEKVLLDSSSKAGEYFLEEPKFEKNETFLLASLDSQNRLIATTVISKGTINETAIYPRIIVEAALKHNANTVILAHNHPGASLNPSSSDIATTKRLVEALRTVDIKTIDHIIICGNQYVSFAEKGLL